MKHSLDLLNWKNLPQPLPPWFLAQALSWINRSTTLIPGNNGWSFKQTLNQLLQKAKNGELWCETKQVDPYDLQGMWTTLNTAPRGTILPAKMVQTSMEGLPYSAGVPLILSSFKTYRNVDYETWDWSEGPEAYSYWLDQNLVEVRKFSDFEIFWSPEKILEIRTLGTTFKSGPRAGTTKSPASATTINNTGVEQFDTLPRLVKLMITQCWIWNTPHPLVVGSLSNWDQHDALTTDCIT